MKKIIVKRLMYTSGRTGEEHIGAIEYDGNLSDNNILCSVHEVGKTAWIGNALWLLRNGVPTYRITVLPFTQYQKSWYDLLLDAIRRI